MLGQPAARIQDVHLPLQAAGVAFQQRIDDRLRGLAGAQARHGGDGVQRVDQRLGGHGADAALHMDADGADGEEPRGDRGTERAGGGVADEYGPCHARSITRV